MEICKLRVRACAYTCVCTCGRVYVHACVGVILYVLVSHLRICLVKQFCNCNRISLLFKLSITHNLPKRSGEELSFRNQQHFSDLSKRKMWRCDITKQRWLMKLLESGLVCNLALKWVMSLKTDHMIWKPD